jgi:ferredoxin
MTEIVTTSQVLDLAGLRSLIEVLHERGYAVIAPTVRDGAIVHAEIDSIDDLPRGRGDAQQPGRYELTNRGDDTLFGYAAVAQSWKSWLFPARQLMWRGHRDDDGFHIDTGDEPPPYAFLGVRSCDLHAIAVQDRILADRPVADADYVAKRRRCFIVAVACAVPGGTCFCASMGTGPTPDRGYDLTLTELVEGGHRFMVQAGSDEGQAVLAAIAHQTATSADAAEAAQQEQQSISRMGRHMDPTGLRDLLFAKVDSPHWDEVASRCLACGNCTLVCPTCFCTSVEDVSDLDNTDTEHWRVWDSCYSNDFSYLHGGSVRTTIKSRYRQWLTHKLASWHDQFGTSGRSRSVARRRPPRGQ